MATWWYEFELLFSRQQFVVDLSTVVSVEDATGQGWIRAGDEATYDGPVTRLGFFGIAGDTTIAADYKDVLRVLAKYMGMKIGTLAESEKNGS